MKRTILYTFIAAGLLLAGDEVVRHKAAMDQAQEWKDDLRDALDAKDAAKAAELAKKLVDAAAAEAAYWQREKFEDVKKLAADNLAAAQAVREAARAGRLVEAEGAYGRLESSCRACHDLHPEKRVK